MKIDFSFDTDHGKFVDAIVLTDDHTFSDAEIEDMKQQRLDNWIAVVSYAPTEEEIIQTETLAQEQPPEE